MSRIKDIVNFIKMFFSLVLQVSHQSQFQRNATKKYFPVVLLSVPWRVILTSIKITEPVA